jgi:hypothetical protein
LIGNTGEVAFNAGLSGTGVTDNNEQSIWIGYGADLRLVARENSPAPGTSGDERFSELANPWLDATGQVMFSALLRGTGVNANNSQGIWKGASDSPDLLARAGTEAPGLPGFTLSTILTPLLADSGKIVFNSQLNYFPATQFAIWGESEGNLTATYRSFNFAPPGAPGGSRFSSFDLRAVDGEGHVAFRAALSGGGVDNGNDQGVWSDVSGQLELIAREGAEMPAATADEIFLGFGPPLVSPGRTVFLADLAGPEVSSENNTSIWSHDGGQLHLIAREGDQAPGATSGQLFSSISSPIINSVGQVFFGATIVGDGVDSSNDFGLWAEDRQGALRLIVRRGDTIEVAPGDLRTIASFTYSDRSGDNSLGRVSAFNALGQIAFSAVFDDGSAGVFVSNLIAVPESRSCCLLWVGSLLFLLPRQGCGAVCSERQ